MVKNKIEAILERKEIRDGFDIEFLLRRGIHLPELTAKRFLRLKKVIEEFTEKVLLYRSTFMRKNWLMVFIES